MAAVAAAIATVTAPLSIINPLQLQLDSEPDPSCSRQLRLALCISSFKIRLSFHDLKLLANIIASFSLQTAPPANVAFQSESVRHRWSSSTAPVAPLPVAAANLRPSSLATDQYDEDSGIVSHLSLIHMDEAADFVSVCLIDDCVDADVPLYDLKLAGSRLQWQRRQHIASLSSSLSLAHYNTSQFRWTAVVPSVAWPFQAQLSCSGPDWLASIRSTATLDLDLNSQLLYSSLATARKWTNELYRAAVPGTNPHQSRPVEFAPFVLDNQLGCDVRYRKLGVSASPLFLEAMSASSFGGPLALAPAREQASGWTRVPRDSASQPICFEADLTARDKIRYNKQGLHYDYRHRIELLVEGWTKSHPVTVDRLGIFYRDMEREPGVLCDWADLSTGRIRVVVEIVRQGSVQNKIILRSSLLVKNAVNVPLKLQLQHPQLPLTTCRQLTFEAHQTLPVPIDSVHCVMRVQPLFPQNPPSATSSSPDFAHSDCVISGSSSSPEVSNELLSWWLAGTGDPRVLDQQLTCGGGSGVGFVCSVERLPFPTTTGPRPLPGHLVTVSAPLTLTNLLPTDVTFSVSLGGIISSGVDIVRAPVRSSRHCSVLMPHRPNNYTAAPAIELRLHMEAFPRCDPLTIPTDTKLGHDVLVCVYDEADRLLELHARVEARASGPVSVTVYAGYWLINRTSLALVFAQAAASDRHQLAAGQSTENEEARSPAPFMFSFTNRNESQLLQLRLGRGPNSSPSSSSDSELGLGTRWSQKISIDKRGITTLALRAAPLSNPGRPLLSYNVGLEVRPGRGRHHRTTMVIFSARYVLDNRSPFPLHFAQQQCLDFDSRFAKPIMALPSSVMTFHWPREDLDPLLSVQKLDPDNQNALVSKWSGGFIIDKTNSFHIYLKGVDNYKSSQLRITVTQEGAIYRIVFTDVQDIPSPYRLENRTQLQIFFYQDVSDSSKVQHHLLPARSSLPYALDHPTEAAIVNISIEGGTQGSYYLNEIKRNCPSLCYDNFLYLTVLQTVNGTGCDNKEDEVPLVFDVPHKSKRVVLRRKSAGSRSQLWYYSVQNQLFHEGSVAPHDPRQPLDRSQANHLLLDISLLAPQPHAASGPGARRAQYHLTLAMADPRRTKFQRWFFHEDGSLTNLFGIKCRIDRYVEGAVVTSGYEVEKPHLIHKEFLRPGSGMVDVSVSVDGPTRVVRLVDRKERTSSLLASPSTSIESQHSSCLSKLELSVSLRGLGFFLVDSDRQEELVYAHATDLALRWSRQGWLHKLDFELRRLQVDNQLLDTGFPCLLYEKRPPVTPGAGSKVTTTTTTDKPAFSVTCEKDTGHDFDVHVFNYVKARLMPMTVILEERLMLKIIQMLTSVTGPLKPDGDESAGDEEEEVLGCMRPASGSRTIAAGIDDGRKVYIGRLQLLCGTICLSVIASESLTPDLRRMKKLVPSLMSFANAQISIEPFDEEHIFETAAFIGDSLFGHARQQLRSQAIKIFGTVDFLGNPVGFLSDMSSAVRMFYSDQNVQSMVRHFAHGIGDSTAKICGSASRLVSELAMDPAYELQRQHLFETARRSDSKTAQMMAGFRSLMHGLYGGVKSVPSQSWRGYQDEGASGLILGTVKGVLGVVAKPVGGMLDLATGTATSFREMARSSQEGRPPRRHAPRQRLFLPVPSSAACDRQQDNMLGVSDRETLVRAERLLARLSTGSSGTSGNSTGNSAVVVAASGSAGHKHSTTAALPLSGKRQEKIVGLLPLKIPDSTISNNTNREMEVLVTDCSVYVVKCQPQLKLLKSYGFSVLSVPPVCISAQDGSLYLRFCPASTTAPSTVSATDDPEGRMRLQTVHSFSSFSSATGGLFNTASMSPLLPGAGGHANSTAPNGGSVSGPLFKVDSLHLGQLIVRLVCEAYSDFVEGQLTLNSSL